MITVHFKQLDVAPLPLSGQGGGLVGSLLTLYSPQTWIHSPGTDFGVQQLLGWGTATFTDVEAEWRFAPRTGRPQLYKGMGGLMGEGVSMGMITVQCSFFSILNVLAF